MPGRAHGADPSHVGHLLEAAAALTGIAVVAGAAVIARVRRGGRPPAPARGRARGYSGPSWTGGRHER
jgi:hypothetical protein